MCESVIHFKKDCLHKTQNNDGSTFETLEMQVNAKVDVVYKVTDHSCKDKQVFISAAMNAAALDSACSKTIAGHEWQEKLCFISSKWKRS